LRSVCTGFPDPRKGRSGNIAVADFGLSAFAMFFMQSASFLAFQRVLEKGQGRSNCQTLFGIEKIPSDNYIRDMVDEADLPSRPCAKRLAGWAAESVSSWTEPNIFARKKSTARIASPVRVPTARPSPITPCWRQPTRPFQSRAPHARIRRAARWRREARLRAQRR
jgi:hypothetical protein